MPTNDYKEDHRLAERRKRNVLAKKVCFKLTFKMGEGNLFIKVLREGTAKFGGYGSIDVSSHLGLKLEELRKTRQSNYL